MPRDDHGTRHGGRSVDPRAPQSTLPKSFEVAVSRALDTLPYGAFKTFGDALGLSDTWVGRMRDPFDAIHLRASQVPRALQAVGTVEPLNAVLREVRIAGCRWHVVPAPELAEPEDIRLEAMEAAGSLGAYLAHLGRALADGHLDGPELVDLEAQLVELQEQIGAQLAGIRGRRGVR